MKNKKGFTLVEMLAVVVLLGVLFLIAFNVILPRVKKSKQQAFIADVSQYIKSTSYDTLVKDKIDQFVIYNFPNSGIDLIKNKKIKVGNDLVDKEVGFMIKDENDNVRIQIWNRDLNICAVKSFTDKQVDIDNSLDTEEKCVSFLYDLKDNDQVSVKSLTGENYNYNLKSSCYTLDEDNKIDNYDTSECGPVFVIPNKINGSYVTGFTDDFKTNAPKDFVSLYIIGVQNITETPTSLLGDSPNVTKAVLSNLPNLVKIYSGIVSGSPKLETFYLTDCPNLEFLSSGIVASNPVALQYITLRNLPKLESIGSIFFRTEVKKLDLSNFDSLTEITSSAFTGTNGDTEVTISNNPKLTKIQNSAFSDSNLLKLDIFNNELLTSITNGGITHYDSSSTDCYIDELLIHDNPSLSTIDNSSFTGFIFKSVKIYNNPNLKNIRYGAFGSIKAEVFDLSDTTLEELNFSAFGGAKIDKLILPPTITSITYGSASNLNSIVTNKIEFGGNDKCSLINLFRTTNPDNTYNYLVDKNKLPDCP